MPSDWICGRIFVSRVFSRGSTLLTSELETKIWRTPALLITLSDFIGRDCRLQWRLQVMVIFLYSVSLWNVIFKSFQLHPSPVS
ncbi:hypothetical protein AAHA92_32553 [Salvia divinorum]|uniref:Uncharacterized protein n=1 Tax=Salvia divinorum TaxID=28513 RepID=A0ABD1FPC3_SALDI